MSVLNRVVCQDLPEDISFIMVFNEKYRESGSYDDNDLWSWARKMGYTDSKQMPDWSEIAKGMFRFDLQRSISSFIDKYYQDEISKIQYDNLGDALGWDLMDLAESISYKFISKDGEISFLGDYFPIVDEMTYEMTDNKMIELMSKAISDYAMENFFAEKLENIPEPTNQKNYSPKP